MGRRPCDEVEEEEEDCDNLGGTDSDAQEFESVNDDRERTYNILRFALWVETSLIPRNACLVKNKKLTWTDVDAIKDEPWE